MKQLRYLLAFLATILVAEGAYAFTPRLDYNFYMDNLEHFNRFREGYSLFGTSAAGYIYHDVGPLHVEAGLYLRTEFGSEKFLDQFAPWLRIEAKKGPWFIVGGALHNEDRFGLSDALYYRDRSLEYPLDMGAQTGYKGEHFYQEFWISWYKLNTPEHREAFAAGSRTEFDWKNFHAELDVLESHHGGQLYDAGQPVADNVSMQLTLQYFHPWGKYWGIGGSASALGSIYVFDRGNTDLNNYSSGIELALYWRIYAIDMGFSYYQTLTEDRFITELGNALYQTNQPLWQLWAERAFQIGPSDLVLGARMYLFEETVEYCYSLIWRVGLDGGRFRDYIKKTKERRLAKEEGRNPPKEKVKFEPRKAFPFQTPAIQAQRHAVAFSEPVFTDGRNVTNEDLRREPYLEDEDLDELSEDGSSDSGLLNVNSEAEAEPEVPAEQEVPAQLAPAPVEDSSSDVLPESGDAVSDN